MKRKAFRKGMTLVEVLVASLILVIVVVASMTMFTTYHRLAVNDENKFLAENEIRKSFEDLHHWPDQEQAIKSIATNVTSLTGTLIKPALVLGTPRSFTMQGVNGASHTFTIEYQLISSNLYYLGGAVTPKFIRVVAIVKWGGTSSLTMETILNV